MNLHKVKNLAINALLILVSLTVSLAIVEISLRLFYPKYQYAAESIFDRSSIRIWERKPNTHYKRIHPDTGQSHTVYHNNLALRQHRNFTEQDIESSTNLGFFGDSFTENLRLPAQYSLTEPLDYLLNKRVPKFNVLNFGVDGYGTDQEYLYYRDAKYSHNLNYVFYIFCLNDLRNIYENNLFTLNDAQKLVFNSKPATPWWINILSRFHTTYLAIDIFKRLQSRELALDKTAIEERRTDIEQHYAKEDCVKRFHDQHADAIEPAFMKGEKTEDLEQSIRIFQALVRRWSNEVKSNGGKFYVILLPRENEHKARSIIANDINVIDLYVLFRNSTENYDYNDWRFKNDGHWNEAGNLLAAINLYRFMERDLDLPAISEDMLKQRLYTYYSSFDGWMPDEKYLERTVLPEKTKQDIKSKYLSLEMNNTGR